MPGNDVHDLLAALLAMTLFDLVVTTDMGSTWLSDSHQDPVEVFALRCAVTMNAGFAVRTTD